MACIIVTNVEVKQNPAKYTDPFVFDVTFEVIPPGIKDELEWKLIYVGSADDSECDQELDSVFVGPVSVGRNKFTFEAPAPDTKKIPREDLLGVTVVLLTCSYKAQEFIRIGYYVANEYEGELPVLPQSDPPEQPAKENPPPEADKEAEKEGSEVKEGAQVCAQGPAGNNEDGITEATDEPQPKLDLSKIEVAKMRRNILSDKPRITKFQITWDQPATSSAPQAMAIDDS